MAALASLELRQQAVEQPDRPSREQLGWPRQRATAFRRANSSSAHMLRRLSLTVMARAMRSANSRRAPSLRGASLLVVMGFLREQVRSRSSMRRVRNTKVTSAQIARVDSLIQSQNECRKFQLFGPTPPPVCRPRLNCLHHIALTGGTPRCLAAGKPSRGAPGRSWRPSGRTLSPGVEALASFQLLMGIKLGLAPELGAAPWRRFCHRLPASRSSAARPRQEGDDPRPMGVVRLRWGLSSTFSSDPRLWIRPMMCGCTAG